jgi:predicted metal-dependent phosphoesterase TrpH
MKPLAAALVALGSLLAAASSAAGQGARPLNWYRCNTHTHTTAPVNSDANGTPWFVADWYKTHGYKCLVITDHELLTDVDSLNKRFGPDFLVIRGQEITQGIEDATKPSGVRGVHVNGIDIDRLILPLQYPKPAVNLTNAEAYRRNLAAVYDAGGLPQVNHPNMGWSVRKEDLLAIDRPFLLEVWNAFPTHNNLGGVDVDGRVLPSTEQLWDSLLSAGKTVWATASDDVHEYYDRYDRTAALPGMGWIVIQAPELTRESLMAALRQGHFYASNGPVLGDYAVDAKGVSLTIQRTTFWNSTFLDDRRYTTRFVGENGKLLAEVPGFSARYDFRPGERYVRASIIDSDGRRAWTQPVFLDKRGSPTAPPIQ